MNRECALKRIRADPTYIKNSVMVLQGGKDTERFDSGIIYIYLIDLEPLFRQESYFNYCFGVQEPGYYGLIDIDSGKSVLFPPEY